MTIATYDELKTAIADFLNRDDLTSVIPTFIALAEAQLDRDIRHWRQEKRVTTTLNEQYENLPSDFLELVSLTVDGNIRLELISTAEMQVKKAVSTAAGRPRYFRMTAGQIEFYPLPDTSYSMSMEYFAKTPALSASASDNWILVHAADAYLYGALLHAAPYLKDDARVQVWSALYLAAIEALKKQSEAAKFSGPLKMRVSR